MFRNTIAKITSQRCVVNAHTNLFSHINSSGSININNNSNNNYHPRLVSTSSLNLQVSQAQTQSSSSSLTTEAIVSSPTAILSSNANKQASDYNPCHPDKPLVRKIFPRAILADFLSERPYTNVQKVQAVLLKHGPMTRDQLYQVMKDIIPLTSQSHLKKLLNHLLSKHLISTRTVADENQLKVIDKRLILNDPKINTPQQQQQQQQQQQESKDKSLAASTTSATDEASYMVRHQKKAILSDDKSKSKQQLLLLASRKTFVYYAIPFRPSRTVALNIIQHLSAQPTASSSPSPSSSSS